MRLSFLLCAALSPLWLMHARGADPLGNVGLEPVRVPTTLRDLAAPEIWPRTFELSSPDQPTLRLPTFEVAPSGDFRIALARINRADRAVIESADRRARQAADVAWVAKFIATLSSAGSPPPLAKCFCVAPSISFYAGDDLLLTVQLTHDRRVRITGLAHLGDFIVPESIYTELASLTHVAPR